MYLHHQWLPLYSLNERGHRQQHRHDRGERVTRRRMRAVRPRHVTVLPHPPRLALAAFGLLARAMDARCRVAHASRLPHHEQHGNVPSVRLLL